MNKIIKITWALLVIAFLIFSNSKGQESNNGDPVVKPKEFSIKLLEILACPENLTTLHLAKKSEITKVNELIKKRRLKYWNGTVIKDQIEAMLIRKDNKIGYEIKEGIPIMIIDNAIVLDDTVGPPDPNKHRKR